MAEILSLFEKSLKKSTAEQTELVCEKEEFYLTRFADSVIHQNMGRTDHTIWCRAINGKKIGIAKTNILSGEAIDNLVAKAVQISSEQNEDSQFVSLVASPTAPKTKGYYDTTAECTPDERARAVKTIVDIAAEDKLNASGMFQTSRNELIIANSLGTTQQGKVTEARLSVTLSNNDGRSGFAQAYARDESKIDFQEIAHRAVQKAERLASPIELEPGSYTVILEPEAAADFLLFLGFLGFGGKGLVSRRSFMADKIGSKIMNEKITISEDPFNPEINYLSFDYEGVPRRKVKLVENGIAVGAVYDSYYAKLNDTESTGNALAPDNSYGPYPKAMVMEPGAKSIEEMIASTERGILITHFWYLNFVNPMLTTVTGTTRDGTFLIENGKISKPIKDMRINQSMLEAFNNVELLSKSPRLVYKYSVLMYVPAMKITGFNFVSTES
jgi:PmbA protein